MGNFCRNRYWARRLGIAPGAIVVFPGGFFWGVDTLSMGSGISINVNTIIDASQGCIRIGNDVLIGPNVVIRAATTFSLIPPPTFENRATSGGRA